MKHLIAATALVLVLGNSACSNSSSEFEYSSTAPMTDYCSDHIKKELPTLIGDLSIQYEIEEFDQRLKPHPYLIGSLTLRSNLMDQKALDAFINTVFSGCLPNSSSKVFKDESFDKNLSMQILMNTNLNTGSTYFVDYEDRLELFYTIPQ